jgi:hypothetical protein
MNDEASRDSSSNVVLIVVGVIVGVLVLVVLACVGFGFLAFRAVQVAAPAIEAAAAEWTEADTAAQAFLANLAAGQVETAYRSTTPAFQQKQTLQQFQAFVDQHPLLKQHTDVEHEDDDHNPGAAKIAMEYTLTGKGGETKVTIQLVNENGQWKVDGLTVP